MRFRSRRQANTFLIPLGRDEQVALVGGASLPSYRAPSLTPLVEPSPHTLADMLLALGNTPH